MPEIHDGTKTDKHAFKLFVSRPPINHRARHWGTLARVPSVYQKTKTGVVEKRNSVGYAKHCIFPMSSVSCYRYKSKNLRIKPRTRFGAFQQPIPNSRPSFPVTPIRRINEHRSRVPWLHQPIRIRKAKLDRSSNNGMLIRARVQRDFAAKKFPNRVHVFGRRAPVVA